MEQVPAPDGVFELRNLINPGACPRCGDMVKTIWYYLNKDTEDRFIRSSAIVMSCEKCAKMGGKK